MQNKIIEVKFYFKIAASERCLVKTRHLSEAAKNERSNSPYIRLLIFTEQFLFEAIKSLDTL